MPHSTEDALVKPTVEAREGVAGNGVRYALSFSFAGAVVLLAIVLLVVVG